MKKLLPENGLSFTLTIITLLTLGGQLVVGWHTVNNELTDYHQPAISFAQYLTSGHCIEAVFENWESEFCKWGCMCC